MSKAGGLGIKTLLHELKGDGAPAPGRKGPTAPTRTPPLRSTVRYAFHMRPDLLEKLRHAAWWERTTVTELVNAAVAAEVERLERKRGEPYPTPAGKLPRGRRPAHIGA